MGWQDFIDWHRVTTDLKEIEAYFNECMKNAGKDSTAQKKFIRYVAALTAARNLTEDTAGEEDDGR